MEGVRAAGEAGVAELDHRPHLVREMDPSNSRRDEVSGALVPAALDGPPMLTHFDTQHYLLSTAL